MQFDDLFSPLKTIFLRGYLIFSPFLPLNDSFCIWAIPVFPPEEGQSTAHC